MCLLELRIQLPPIATENRREIGHTLLRRVGREGWVRNGQREVTGEFPRSGLHEIERQSPGFGIGSLRRHAEKPVVSGQFGRQLPVMLIQNPRAIAAETFTIDAFAALEGNDWLCRA